MPYDFDVHPEEKLVRFRAWGPAVVEDVIEAMERIISHPKYAPAFSILIDASQMEYVASFADALAIRDKFEEHRESFRGPIAMVVTAPVQFAITRVVASLADLFGVRVGVFRDMASARGWIAEENREKARDGP
ncbi:MAG: hypothetical protein ACREOU_15015 [Candidatus Eiseniibacteriota bacterium]